MSTGARNQPSDLSSIEILSVSQIKELIFKESPLETFRIPDLKLPAVLPHLPNLNSAQLICIVGEDGLGRAAALLSLLESLCPTAQNSISPAVLPLLSLNPSLDLPIQTLSERASEPDLVIINDLKFPYYDKIDGTLKIKYLGLVSVLQRLKSCLKILKSETKILVTLSNSEEILLEQWQSYFPESLIYHLPAPKDEAKSFWLKSIASSCNLVLGEKEANLLSEAEGFTYSDLIKFFLYYSYRLRCDCLFDKKTITIEECLNFTQKLDRPWISFFNDLDEVQRLIIESLSYFKRIQVIPLKEILFQYLKKLVKRFEISQVINLSKSLSALEQKKIIQTVAPKHLEQDSLILSEPFIFCEEPADRSLNDLKILAQVFAKIFSKPKFSEQLRSSALMLFEGLINTRNYPEAYQIISRLLDLDPQNPLYLYYLALTLFYLDEYQKALLPLQKIFSTIASAATASDFQLRCLEASCLSGAGEFKPATDKFHKLKKDYPKEAFLDFSIGIHYNRQKLYQEALDSYQQALVKDPKFVAAYQRQGNTYIALGKKHLAVNSYQKALEINPRFPEVCCKKANKMLSAKRNSEALQWFEKALQIEPNCKEAITGKIKTLIAMKKMELAANYLRSTHNLFLDHKDYQELKKNFEKQLES